MKLEKFINMHPILDYMINKSACHTTRLAYLHLSLNMWIDYKFSHQEFEKISKIKNVSKCK